MSLPAARRLDYDVLFAISTPLTRGSEHSRVEAKLSLAFGDKYSHRPQLCPKYGTKLT